MLHHWDRANAYSNENGGGRHRAWRAWSVANHELEQAAGRTVSIIEARRIAGGR
jgi:hypothetical protein